MRCNAAREALESLYACEETEYGLRVRTHCLFPSFSQVEVFIVKIGDGFRIHDGGSAAKESWLHGRDDHLISSCLKREGERFHLEIVNDSLVASAHDEQWLPAAILAVANASSAAAYAAVSKLSVAAEESLVERIGDALARSFAKDKIVKKFSVRGKSGKEHAFDFALLGDGRNQIIIDAVSPHHASIASKYVAFSDSGGQGLRKFAVFERPLLRDDVSLMQQVAQIVPLAALVEGSRRALIG
jgi:hypothetical protein